MKFIQITDLHLVPPGELNYGLDPEKMLRACLDDIAARHADAEFVIATGDLTQAGNERAYRLLKEILDGWRMLPVHLLIGNHDDRATFRRVFPSAPVDPAGFVQFTLDTSAGRFICLDTNEKGDHWGLLSPERLEWLGRELARAGDAPVHLFMHHPPFNVGIRKMDTIALKNGQEFAALIAGHRNVRHIFFGHMHRPISGCWHGIPFSFLPAMNHQVALDFVIEDDVPGSHEPPAYAVVFVEPELTLVHLHNFLDRTATFNL